jgi:hypothetical protein
MMLLPRCRKSGAAVAFEYSVLLLLIAASLPVGHARRHRRDAVTPSPLAGCDVFSGGWVRDDVSTAAASYTGFNCPVIDAEFNCQLYGRPDSDYLRYRWKPAGCDLPRYVVNRAAGVCNGSDTRSCTHSVYSVSNKPVHTPG